MDSLRALCTFGYTVPSPSISRPLVWPTSAITHALRSASAGSMLLALLAGR
jgi:hypothetical protein